MDTFSFATTFLRSQLFVGIPKPTAQFTNQTVIVTGSNAGLGLEAARHLARLGTEKLILAVRTLSKGNAARDSILAETPGAAIEVWELNMSSYASIKRFAKRCERLERLDAALLNAGILTFNAEVLEGNESTLTVNVIGTTLLATLLLPTMQRSAAHSGLRGRLSVVGSDTIYIAPIAEALAPALADEPILPAINKVTAAQMSNRYAFSKQLLAYTLKELALRNPLPEKGGVIIADMTPGMCKSTLFRDNAGFLVKMALIGVNTLVARRTEVGGRTLVHAVQPELTAEAHGRFLMDCKVAVDGPNLTSADGKLVAKKWNAELLALVDEIVSRPL